MEKALRNRLTFGPLMLLGLFAIFYFDHAIQVWTTGKIPGLYGAGLAGVGLLVLMLMILPIAVQELAALFAAERVRPYMSISSIGCTLLTIHGFLTQFHRFQVIATSVLAFIIVFVMLLAAARRAMHKTTHDAIVHMAGTVLATLYLGGLNWFLMALRVKHSASAHHFNGSTGIILTILLVVKATDIGAYFGGRAFGRNKLIPWLSPGKTWEGLFFGLLTSGAVGAVASQFIKPTNYVFPWWKGLIFGIVIGGVGQLGDLLESLMKRDAEVKDSGKLVPGFGGILDIIDSPLLAAPFAYLMFSLF